MLFVENIENIFIDNYDFFNFTDKFYSFPLALKNLNNSNTSLVVTSGIPFNISFEIKDYYQQRVLFDNETILTLKITSEDADSMSLIKLQNNLAISLNGVVNFKECSIFSRSNITINFELQGIFMPKFFISYQNLY